MPPAFLLLGTKSHHENDLTFNAYHPEGSQDTFTDYGSSHESELMWSFAPVWSRLCVGTGVCGSRFLCSVKVSVLCIGNSLCTTKLKVMLRKYLIVHSGTTQRLRTGMKNTIAK